VRHAKASVGRARRSTAPSPCRATARPPLLSPPPPSARPGRFELPTPGSVDQCSIQLSYGRRPLSGLRTILAPSALSTPHPASGFSGSYGGSQPLHTHGESTTALPSFPLVHPRGSTENIRACRHLTPPATPWHEHCSWTARREGRGLRSFRRCRSQATTSLPCSALLSSLGLTRLKPLRLVLFSFSLHLPSSFGLFFSSTRRTRR
jgi:hypothetical protein